MERSEEIRRIVHRWMIAISASDSTSALGRPIRVRIGVHTGDALREADHFFGTTVHHAARVAIHALGGEVRVSNLVRELVAGPGVEFLESREVELKGREGSHRLFAVDLR